MAKKPNLPVWPADQVKRRAVDELLPYARNARLHSPEQIEQIAASMDEYGVTNAIIIDEKDEIVAGHGRVLAAKLRGFKTVPTVVVRGWSEEKKRRYRIIDNRLAELSVWDPIALQAELVELHADGLDLELTGFSAKALEALSIEIPGFTAPPAPPSVLLSDRFGVAPFSVLNAREGWWQARKLAWIRLGIQSELGRGENLLKFSDSVKLDGKVYKDRQKAKSKKRAAPAAA